MRSTIPLDEHLGEAVAGKRKNTRRMHKLRDEFFDQGKRLAASDDPDKRAAARCWLCKQDIDYDVEPGSTEDSHNLDHYYPVDDYPELQEDPTNFRHSHRRCNGTRGKRTPSVGLGEQVPEWW